MHGKAVLIAAAVSTVFGCGTITPIDDPDAGTATVSVAGGPGGRARLDAGPALPAAKKNAKNDQGNQSDEGGDGNGSGPGSS
jgi:hypothetical protein